MIRSRRHPTTILLLLTLTLFAVAAVSLDLGSTRMSLGQVATTLLGQGQWIDNLVIFDLRLPRLVLSILIGMGVATSGVILQGITRNDLAGPDTVGVNAGSGLGMMFLLVAYPTASTTMPWLLPLGSVVGAIAITTLVFALAYRRGSVLPSRLLLVGIAIGFGAHAAMLLFSMRMSFSMYNFVVSWMAGTLSAGDWKSVRLLTPCCLVLIPMAVSRARVLNTFSLGDGVAANLGVNVERQRLLLLGTATMLTAACVAVGGHIGFLGLAAPHLARRLVGQSHGILFPAAALCGAILLLTADSLGRHILAPIEVPAGVLVGILGGAYFLYLLATTKG
jgi:iron complex transport system permease protein